jgi:hypothetical protein
MKEQVAVVIIENELINNLFIFDDYKNAVDVFVAYCVANVLYWHKLSKKDIDEIVASKQCMFRPGTGVQICSPTIVKGEPKMSSLIEEIVYNRRNNSVRH